jgi:hypothetical protein
VEIQPLAFLLFFERIFLGTFVFCFVLACAWTGAFLHRVWDNAVPQQHPAIVKCGARLHRDRPLEIVITIVKAVVYNHLI